MIFENLVNHSSGLLNRLKKFMPKNSDGRQIIFYLLFDWLICSTILSQCFTSVLLNVYFIKKPSLTVESLEDIMNNQHLLVAGYPSLKELEPIRPDVYHALKERTLNYHKNLDNDLSLRDLPFNSGLLKDIVERKAVVLCHTFVVNFFKQSNQGLNLKESDQKFSQLFRYSLVSKYSPHHTKIQQL